MFKLTVKNWSNPETQLVIITESTNEDIHVGQIISRFMLIALPQSQIQYTAYTPQRLQLIQQHANFKPTVYLTKKEYTSTVDNCILFANSNVTQSQLKAVSHFAPTVFN